MSNGRDKKYGDDLKVHYEMIKDRPYCKQTTSFLAPTLTKVKKKVTCKTCIASMKREGV